MHKRYHPRCVMFSSSILLWNPCVEFCNTSRSNELKKCFWNWLTRAHAHAGAAIIAANVAWDYFSRQFIFPRRYSSVVAKNRIVEVIYQAWEAVFHHQMHEILRRELKIRGAAEYFRQTSKCFIWWWNTVLNAWYYISNKMILEREIKDAKMSSFTSDFQTLIKH